ncbi:hypothetical protein [uncultured Clostridium sp.]|uniref:hypothetical protein n=1 Tax=uncultured Clostridium sp. TaxID=59620 RepID=UPI0028EC0E5F|nr:hypothetical protein [uncultured Clostridium sp.]
MVDKLKSSKENINNKQEIITLITFIFIGLIMGVVAKWCDTFAQWGNWLSTLLVHIGFLGSGFGIWIFLGAYISVKSKTPLWACIKVPLFFLSMLLSYYLYSIIIVDYFSKKIIYGWCFFSLLTTIFAYCYWYAKGDKLINNIICAIPIGMIIAHTIPTYRGYSATYILEIIFAIILLFIVKKDKSNRIKALGLSLVFAILFSIIPIYELIFGYLL